MRPTRPRIKTTQQASRLQRGGVSAPHIRWFRLGERRPGDDVSFRRLRNFFLAVFHDAASHEVSQLARVSRFRHFLLVAPWFCHRKLQAAAERSLLATRHPPVPAQHTRRKKTTRRQGRTKEQQITAPDDIWRHKNSKLFASGSHIPLHLAANRRNTNQIKRSKSKARKHRLSCRHGAGSSSALRPRRSKHTPPTHRQA